MSKLMSKLIKQTLSCIFILLTLGLFLTCDDPNMNPFTSDMGPKVVVEKPTIYDISPVSGSYLSGVVTFTATAKAYIKVEKVEIYIFEDEANKQREIPWTDRGIQLAGSVKLKTMTYEFDTKKFNSGEDGSIRIKFRVFDTTDTAVESIELVYIIKNNPSVITMAYPDEEAVKKASEPAKVMWNGEIRGQVIDRRGLRPGYPQIKLWPADLDEPPDNDPQWGWASLFLTGYDNIEKEGADTDIAPAGYGTYADRSKLRVVNAASFSLHLAKYTIVPDERYPDNPDLRCVRYDVENNKHVPFEANGVYKFKIRTRDVSPDPLNGSIPCVDPDQPWPNNPDGTPWTPWIEGFFPPKDFGTPLVDNFHIRSTDGITEEPVLITIFSSDSKLTVELNNDDIEEGPNPNDLTNKPNIYIQRTEKTSYKIEQAGFRLRLLVFFDGKDGGEISKAELEWQHKNGDNVDTGSLNWDGQVPGQDYKGEANNYGDGIGRVFTFTSPPNSPIFTHSTVRYVLVFKVWIKGQGLEEKDAQKYYFYVYIDGKGPTVSIRSVQGAADVKAETGAAAVAYTVNGNIQAVVDSKDENSIMAYSKVLGDDMGVEPPELDNYPMVKWIVDTATAAEVEPLSTRPVQEMLNTYKANPTWDNLRYFKAIDDTLVSPLTSLPSGWVRRPLPAGSDADKNNHFKLNTLPLTDKGYYWLYVIGMDQVQNLGYTVKKIYVDQDTDIPGKDVRPLTKDNTQITNEGDLDVNVAVNVMNGAATKSGNWSADGRSNVLDRDDNIILNFTDDDGISLEKGGVSIILRDLNTPPAPNNPVTFNADNAVKLEQLKKLLTGGERDMSGTLSQKIMADAFYGAASEGKLKDGKYSIEITIKDDIDKKVAIGAYDRNPPQTITGDSPATATTHVVYYFAVSTNDPVITIEKPLNGDKASAVPIDIKGTVKSRFKIQSLWITFNPNVAAYSPNTNPNPGSSFIPLTMTPVAGQSPDADGYYVYNWERTSVVFNPSGLSAADMSRRFTVVAYDQLGNTNSEECVLRVDDSPPSINLIEFNYKRPADSDGKAYVYGKVPFIVSASDTGGLLDEKVDGFLMSGIKWWVFEVNAPELASLPNNEPSWNTPFKEYTVSPMFDTPTAPKQPKWTGGGYFRDNQKRSGGQYTGVIDTRYLKDKTTEYKLYLMAMDIAGNIATEDVIIKTGAINKFTVDQSRDQPVIYENNLNPKPGNVVVLTNLTISGRVGDADLFDPATTDNKNLSHIYVEIRFPSAVDSSGAPTAWAGWIPIDIPSTYGVAGIDPGNAIVYRFRLDDYSAKYPAAYNYLKDDGPKYYQIRVTDEPDAGPDGKNYGKNPDEFMRTARDQTGVQAPITDPNYNPNYGNLLYPNYNSAVYQKHDKISKIFPLDNKKAPTDPDAYKFFVDISKPEIFFNLADPTVGHENYSADRLTFSQWEQLKRALNNQNYLTGAADKHGKGNYIKEYKLRNLSFSWSAGSNTTPFIKVLLNNPDDPAIAGEYPWDLSGFTGPVATAGTDDAKLKAIFDAVPQGLQIIVFEATDMVDQTGRASWVFAKDTQGPVINFNNISRAIKRDLPLSDPFPADWPSDWPTNRHTAASATWKAWTAGWKTIITNWPSEYAFRTVAEVAASLKTEDDYYKNTPSTVPGDENSVIKGTFEDEYSSVRITVPAGVKTFFYYRFKDKNGNPQSIPTDNKLSTRTIDGITWIEKEIEPALSGQNAKSASWEIILDKANGFGGTDGENWVDIRVADTADNISEIFNVAFLVDRTPPLLGRYSTYTPPNNEIIPGEFRISKYGAVTPTNPDLWLPEDQRVFSAAGADDADTSKLFQISGRVNDYNLSYMKITLGQDGITSYSIISEAVIDPIARTVTSYKDSDGYTDGTHTRLTLAGPYVAGTLNTPYTAASTGVPEWEWTLDILGKDAFGLRKAAVFGSDDEYSIRRYIRVTASDKSGKSVAPVEWPFYLDTKKPVIEYTNLDKGRAGSSFESDVKLSGLVSDDTKIKDLKYIIGRWEYGAIGTNKWRWYDGAGWTLTAPPTDLTKWADYLTTETRLTAMDFTIDNAKLNATGKYPTDLLKTEGQYRLDLYVTDWSLGNGNPHNTTMGDNSEPVAAPPKDTGFKDDGYVPKTDTGYASARVFYIDKNDPTLKWADAIADKTYFRNENSGDDKGKAIFGFIAGDGNTLQNWTAVVRDKDGNIVQTTGGAIKWDVGTGKTSQAIDEPLTVASNVTVPATTAGKLISATSIDEQYFEIKPFMTKTATSGGDALDKDLEILPTYSITITVTDGAKRTSSITKQFTLDNTPPKFITEKYNPQSYKWGDDNKPANPDVIATDPVRIERAYSYDAVTGKLNIRGNTTDNSNQIKSISYYVVNSADSTGFTAYPTPASIEAAGKWRSSAAGNTEIKTGSTTLIQLDEGTLFAWSILAPQTSLFLGTDAVAQTYVKKTTTGGQSIKDETKPAGSYQDVEPSKWTTDPANATNASKAVPKLTFPDLNNPYAANPKVIYGGEDVGLITVYIRAEDAAGNVSYDALKYWIWPEGDRPIVTAINTPDSSKLIIERMLNGTIRLSGMAKDNERVKYVWFRVLDDKGVPYGTGTLASKPLVIPKWQDTDKTTGAPIGGNWDEAGGTQTAVDGSTIGATKTGDAITTPTGGWYMANGGHSRDVSWWAYINTNGELDPTGTDEYKDFTVEVRAQDVTFDEKNNRWMPYENGYMGMASALTDVSKTTGRVVANAPVFDMQRIAPKPSDEAEAAETPPTNLVKYWDTIDNISIRNRSSYKVTVTIKQTMGLSSIRWSPTQWYKDKNVAADIGKFQVNPNIDSFNLLAKNPTGYATYDPSSTTNYVYLNPTGTGYLIGDKTTAFAALSGGTSSMAVHVEIDTSTMNAGYPTKCVVFVDMRADKLLNDMLVNDPDYGNGSAARAGQTKNSVRYPLYLSASDISKPNALTSRGDALLPIDNKEPYGMYTLNRKPAGTAVTIGGEAGDDGPVNGVARVVMWFQKGDQGVSWHGTNSTELPADLRNGVFTAYTANSGPAWWDDVGIPGGSVIPAANGTVAVRKPAIPAVNATGSATVGASAIVIDTNSPSVGVAKWGHKLPMGFADGGIGKLWYVEINSYGIESGPVDLHYVVIDKAGNAKYYKERLVIMNDVAVIDRVKLATDIRHNSSFPAGNSGSLAGAKIDDKAATSDPSLWPILKDIRNKVPLGGADTDLQNDIKKGISDWVSASALGADKVIDFNVRNNLFALRVETTKPPKTKARTFRVEYVSGAQLMSDTGATGRKLTDITAGKIYIINERGTARWGTFGAEGDNWQRGYAFIATVGGGDLDQLAKDNIGTGSAWELTTAQTISTTPSAVGDVTAESAEFQYGTGAFSAITDCSGPTDATFPPTGTWTTWTNANWSLFVLRVYDGDVADYFGDFTILRVRVNNNDQSPPFAQLYDLNPKTEGQDRSNIAGDSQTVDKRRSVSPMFIGEGTGSNRTKGGLWNDSPTLGAVEKLGHIEPRRTGTPGTHSLTSAQMGGAATSAEASITKPFADPTKFIGTTDLVSGQVVLRGYAEDDQRIQRVSLVIGGQTINILDYYNNRAENTSAAAYGAGTAGNSATYTSPKTGLLSIPTAQANNVYFTDSIDAYRHRVEWAYIWDTEAIPSATNVAANDISVRVIAYPRDGAAGTTPKTTGSAEITVAQGKPHVDTLDQTDAIERTRPNTRPFNPGFQLGLIKYNSINVNLRPYITGFLRNKTQFSHDTRSRQGRYMFYRGETAVLKGFNLGSGANTGSISINGTAVNTNNVTNTGDYGITTVNNNHYRQFQVGTGVTTGNGLVTYTFNSRDAVNTSTERGRTSATPVRPNNIMPWNIEYSPGIDGSTLWEDFTQVHIWQSNDTTSGPDGGRFPKGGNSMEVFDPAMSIDPENGNLWESHNEGGGTGDNTGSTKVSSNNGAASYAVAAFIDPITNSDIYISPQNSGYGGSNLSNTVWTVASIIGKQGGGTGWGHFGGIWLTGPLGSSVGHSSGYNVTGNNGFAGNNDVAARSQYHGESTFYNSQSNPPASGPTLNQFMNPHIVTFIDGGNERIHVSYYDTKDKSIKYRYNLRNSPGTINDANNSPRGWTNLDGGIDVEDRDAASGAANFQNVATGNSNRVVNGSRPVIDAGEYNSIALTGDGYPVVAYYDKTNQKIKLAISNSTSPIAASAWRIIDNAISDVPAGRQDSFIGTGQYVSMRIDTRVTPNVAHIAAMNSTNKSLVYIRGTISGTTYTCTDVQVVDSVGSVGRWCSLSLDDQGNPWISYQDESYQGARDGIKLAYKNTTTYYKGSASYFTNKDVDMNNVPITGWEAMHVPTAFRVENARSGMECYPTRNFTGTRNPSTKFWRGAVGFLGQDYFRAAYYVE